MAFYRRRLPHWQPDNADFFVTWRLHGSLPKKTHDDDFLSMDRQLDTTTTGPLYLKDPRVADAVKQVLLAGENDWHLYELFAWVIMANHVHILIHPHVPLSKALMNVNSASARAANAILDRTGNHFWQDESYDHWIRSNQERNSITHYIHANPVSAGLIDEPQAWQWTSYSPIM